MKFLNLAVILRDSEEFSTASLEQIGAWVLLQMHCHDHENYGKITGARLWTDSRWQRIGLPSAEYIAKPSPLWRFTGDDLLVALYNKSKQHQQAKISDARSKASNKRWDEYRARKNGKHPE